MHRKRKSISWPYLTDGSWEVHVISNTNSVVGQLEEVDPLWLRRCRKNLYFS